MSNKLTYILKSSVLAVVLSLTGSAWAGKLGEGITAYYQFNVGSSFTGQKWDTDALVDDANLAFSCTGDIKEAGKLGDYPKFSGNTVLNGGSGGCYVQNAIADSAYPSTSGNWTISLWAKRNGATSHPCLYHHGPSATYTAGAMVEPTSGSNGGIAIYVLNDGKVKVGFSVSSDGSTFSYKTITSSAAFTWANAQANWHNVIVKRDGTTVSLLVDGGTQGTSTISADANLYLDASSKLSLSGTSAMGWQNSTEDLCFWNRALTQGEVAAIAIGNNPISALADQEIPNKIYGSIGSSGNGYYISNNSASPTTVFTDLSLRDMITKYKISGYIGGGSIGEVQVDGVYNLKVGNGVLTAHFQKVDDGYLKCVVVKFQQSGSDIVACALSTCYKLTSAGAALGDDISKQNVGTAVTSDTTSGYGIYGITLTSLVTGESPIAVSGVSKPLAVWNGNFPTTNDGTSTHNGYKLSVKGNTAAADGSKITLASSKPGVEILHVDNNGNKTVANTPFAAIYNMYNLTTSGSRMLGTSIANSGGNFVYNRTMAGLANTTFNSWHSGGSEGTEQIAATFSGNATTMYSIGFLYRPSGSTGTDLYFDGVHVMEADGIKSGSDANNIYGVSLGGSSGTETRWNFPNAEISYVALLNSEAEAEIAAWSLNSMTSSANFSDSGTISGATDYSAKGINLNGGTVALSGNVAAAAVFVWADTTLSFANGATLTVGGDGLGPIYIAEGATLTIDATASSPAGNAAEDLVKGVFYGKSQVSVKTPSSFGASLSDIGVQIGKYLKWGYAGTGKVVTWRTPSTVTGGHLTSNNRYVEFDIEAGADVAGEAAYVNWHHFSYASGASGFDSPYVVRFDGGADYVAENLVADMTPLIFGGLIVESRTGGYSIKDDSTNARETIFGDPSGAETWFDFKENFTNNRHSETHLYGTVNISVAEQKIFTAKATRIYKNAVTRQWNALPTVEAGGTLKMHGEGEMAVSSLNASSACLDYSDLVANRATAFINGPLTIDSATQFRFPANAAFPYPVASSISGLTDGCTTLPAANYTIGGVAGTSELLLLADGTAIPAAVLSVTEDTDWSTLADGCTQTAYVLNVTADATLDIDSAVAGLDIIIFNLINNSTLTLTGATIAADSISTVGTGSVVLNTSGYDVSGLVEGGYVKVLDGAITGSVGVTAVPAASESLIYYYDIADDGIYVRAISATRNSININFAQAANLSTTDLLGLAGVPGNKWDNFSGANGDYTSVSTLDGACSDAYTCPGLKFKISKGYGTWGCNNLTAASELRQGYIDDNAASGSDTPTVDVFGIPFENYRVVVYHSTEETNASFGYDTINGDNLYYDSNKILQSGTQAWGSSGASHSALPIEEGVNTLISGVYTTKPLQIVSHRGGRAGIGAIQIVKSESATIDSAGEYTLAGLFGSAASTAGDYIINVNESATLNIPSDTTVFMVTFNVAEGKTLTITGGTLTGTGSIYINGPGKVVTSTVGQLSGKLKTNAAGLSAGVYELRSWTTPQQYTTTCAGYGTWTVATTGLASGLTAEPVYGAKAVYLRVYDTETQAARKPLVIWPYGDSITEGYNAQHTGTNYRILLYQKLRMLGYNVKSTGVYDLDDGYNAVDPSGTPLTDDDKWHSAKHGAPVSAGISGLAGRGALIENVDTLCVQAGTPDVVLLHIGVNDLSQTSDVDSVFEAWCDVVNRLVRNLPTSKIIVSTALYGRDSQTVRNNRVASYNDKIKAKIADMPTEWVGHVVLADLCSLVDSNTTGILYSLDTVHPDWWGYDQMAEGWLAKILELYNDPDAANFPSQAELPAIPAASALGAENKSELADYRAGFTKYGDIRVAHGQDINNIVYDNVDDDAAASNIGRVGYFVEYVRTDNHAHKWVWVDMDAFGNRDIASMGLPAATQQQVVKHMHVYSNHGAVDNVDADDDTVNGFVEFTPYNIGAAASGIEGAPADSCPSNNQLDWNDTPSANGSGTYSSMQVFRIAPPSGRPAQTIFGFNNWRSFDSNPAEFGIGNFAQHFWYSSGQTLDYVHTRTSVKMNADAYTVKTIEIWTKPEYTATMSATGNFSGLEFSPELPNDISECDLVVNVTDDATLTFDAEKSVGTITFNIAENKTLTLGGTSNLTVGKVILSGLGKLLINQDITIPALNADNEAVIEVVEGKKLTVTGALVVLRGATLTIEHAVPSVSGNYTLISAGSIYNAEAITIDVPSTESLDMETSIVEGDVILAAIPVKMFTYTAIHSDPAQAPSGWFNSWQWDGFNTYMRIGPNADANMVYEVSANEHPGSSLEKTSSFTVSLYADVSQMASDGTTRAVMFSYGGGRDNGNKFLVMYREGNYVKLANWNDGSFTGDWEASVPVATGYHLWTASFNASTGTITLYRDDGTGSGCKSSGTPAASLALASSGNNGLQIGTVWGNCPSTGNFAVGTRMALAGVYGYDVALSDTDMQNIAASYPATDTTVIPAVIDMRSSRTLTVYSSTFDAPLNGRNNYFGVTHGTVVIPEGETVNVTYLQCLNTSWGQNSATLNVEGTLNVTTASTSPDVYNNGGRGILFGHYGGTGAYNITGSLIGRDAYLQGCFTAGAQAINVDGGLLAIKGFSMRGGASASTVTVTLSNGGTIEVAEPQTFGLDDIVRNFGRGTYKAAGNITDTKAINFNGNSVANATIIDPHGYAFSFGTEALTGNGYIKVASSVAEGEKGSVTFAGSAAGFTGTVVIDDANKDLITFTDITAYHGNILYAVTGSSILPSYLSGFAGTLTITGGPVDATGVDLSGATVNIADNCTFTADAGKEGALVLGSGAAVTLNVDDNTVNYEGYVPTVSGSGTVGYYNTTTSAAVSGADYVNGNNLLPYFNVWVPSQDGNNNTISADAATRWRLTRLPDANKNVAFKLNGDATVTIDATIAFNDVQVYGTGTLTIQQSGDNVLTVGKALYTTANAGVQIDSGLAFASGAKLDVACAMPRYIGVNCGTAESPFEIPEITGSGLLIIAENKGLTTGSLTVGNLTVQGKLALTGAGSATTASVYSGGVVDVSSGTSLTVPTLTVNGTVTMGGNTLSATTVTGTGRVEYTNKLPDSSSWSTGTASSGWRGTVAVSGYVHSGNVNKVGWTVGDWGNTYSTLEVSNCAAWYVDNASAGPALKLAGDFQINDGGSAYVTVFASLSGSGTLTVSSGTSATHTLKFGTAEAFAGSIVNGTFKVVIGSSAGENSTISVDGSKVINLADGKSLQSTNIKISGTVNIAGAGALQGVVNINSGATLKFDNIGTSGSPKNLTLSSTLTFASGTVNIVFGEDADEDLYDGATLIDWTVNGSAPAGLFAFADSSLNTNWVLFKEATGLKVYTAHINDNAETPAEAGTISMESDGSLKATVTPTGAAVTLPERITKLEVSVTNKAFGTLTAPGVAANTVVVKYGDMVTTGAYSISKAGNVISFDINTAADAAVDGTKVKPEVADTTPITYTTTTPVLKIKTIPGLWYTVASGSSLDALVNGTPTQATGATTALTAPAIGAGTVIYYKVKVGAKESDLEQ